MKKRHLSSINITINSLNQEQIFDKLIKSNIEISNLQRKDNFETSFFIESKKYTETVKILERYNAKICKENHYGFALIKKTFLKRIGIFVATLYMLIFFIFSNFFILNTKVTGNSILTSAQICEYLKNSYNIKKFSTKNSINTAQLELDLINNFNEISMANVMIRGNTLVVNIKEKSEEEILRQQQKTQSIVSNFNGRILELSLISGTAKVKVGDIVRIGDILVSDSQDNLGVNVQAKAKITAEVWIEKNITHNSCEIVTTHTGKTQKNNAISFMGINVFENKSDCKFENFDTEVCASKLKNTILPLRVETTTFYEVVEKEIKSNYADKREEILTQCKKNALQDLLQNDIIKNEKVIENTVGDCTTLTYVVTVERHLG